MAINPKKKMVLVILMLVISSAGLYLVISTDEIKNDNRVDFRIVDNSTGKYIVTYDPMTGQPHVSIRPEAP